MGRPVGEVTRRSARLAWAEGYVMRSLEAWKVRTNVLTTSCPIYSTKLFLGWSKLLEISDWGQVKYLAWFRCMHEQHGPLVI